MKRILTALAVIVMLVGIALPASAAWAKKRYGDTSLHSCWNGSGYSWQRRCDQDDRQRTGQVYCVHNRRQLPAYSHSECRHLKNLDARPAPSPAPPTTPPSGGSGSGSGSGSGGSSTPAPTPSGGGSSGGSGSGSGRTVPVPDGETFEDCYDVPPGPNCHGLDGRAICTTVRRNEVREERVKRSRTRREWLCPSGPRGQYHRSPYLPCPGRCTRTVEHQRRNCFSKIRICAPGAMVIAAARHCTSWKTYRTETETTYIVWKAVFYVRVSACDW